MEMSLAESLITKGIIRPDIEVEARYKTKSLGPNDGVVVSDSFMIKKIDELEGKFFFTLISTKDGKAIRVSPKAISALDGMEPERFAKVFNINPDGSIRKKGKKRGRKTKYDRMRKGLARAGYRIDPDYEWDKDIQDQVIRRIFPESANENPSGIPDPETVVLILWEYNIPIIERLTQDEPREDEINFFSWNEEDDDDDEEDDE